MILIWLEDAAGDPKLIPQNIQSIRINLYDNMQIVSSLLEKKMDISYILFLLGTYEDIRLDFGASD